MTDVKPESSPSTTPPPASGADGADPLAHLYKMSVTAGLGSTDYVAVNGLAVATVFIGLASALSLVDNVFLVIPLVAVIFAVTALRQIAKSNGTQTGRGLSWLGFILAILFAGSVGGRDIYQAYSNRQDEDQIIQIINQLDQHIRAGEFSKAYLLFTSPDDFKGWSDNMKPPTFGSRTSEQVFADIWRRTAQTPNNGPKLTSIKFNGHIELDMAPQAGMPQAVAMTIFTWDRQIPDQRIAFVFKKMPSGWKIDSIPVLFPTEQQPPRRR